MNSDENDENMEASEAPPNPFIVFSCIFIYLFIKNEH